MHALDQYVHRNQISLVDWLSVPLEYINQFLVAPLKATDSCLQNANTKVELYIYVHANPLFLFSQFRTSYHPFKFIKSRSSLNFPIKFGL